MIALCVGGPSGPLLALQWKPKYVTEKGEEEELTAQTFAEDGDVVAVGDEVRLVIERLRLPREGKGYESPPRLGLVQDVELTEDLQPPRPRMRRRCGRHRRRRRLGHSPARHD